MTDNVIPFKPRRPRYARSEYGGCPKCGELDEMLNTTGESWFVCFEHKTKWPAGTDAFKSRKRETESDWQRNEYKLAEFRTVEAMPPAPDEYPDPPETPDPLHGCDEHGRPKDPNHPWNKS